MQFFFFSTDGRDGIPGKDGQNGIDGKYNFLLCYSIFFFTFFDEHFYSQSALPS